MKKPNINDPSHVCLPALVLIFNLYPVMALGKITAHPSDSFLWRCLKSQLDFALLNDCPSADGLKKVQIFTVF